MTGTIRVLALVMAAIAAAMLADGCSPRGSTPAGQKRANVDYKDIQSQSGPMLTSVLSRVRTITGYGSRQTGQQGCDRTLEYVRKVLGESAPDLPIKDLSTTVTVPIDRLSSDNLEETDNHTHLYLVESGKSEALPAFSLTPNGVQACQTHAPGSCGRSECTNCERPRRVVDLGDGEWERFRGKDLDGAIVLLDFNSASAWLRAASLGAYAAVFVEPDSTTVFQADQKYLATVPVHFPRVYVRKGEAQRIRAALGRGSDARLTLASRLAWRNVTAGGLELTIPGKDRSYAFVLAAHVDARSIAPDLSYGAAETYGIAELLEIVRYFTRPGHQPNCDLRILFVSGHWQQQQMMRDYLAVDGPNFGLVGSYIKLAMAVDLVPQETGLNLLSETSWDNCPYEAYNWMRMSIFSAGGWRDQAFEGLGMMRTVPPDTAGSQAKVEPAVEFYAGGRPVMSETRDDVLADRNARCPLVYAPRYPTAEGAWQALSLPTIAFQTTRLTRLAHNTPLDRAQQVESEALANQKPDGLVDTAEVVKARLRPQIELTLATLEQFLQYPASMLSNATPSPRRPRFWAGYARISGRVLDWDRSIGWFAQRLPRLQGSPATAPAADSRGSLQTLIQAMPTDQLTNRLVSPLADTRVRLFYPWPTVPSMGTHRMLQSFMFQEIRLLDRADFRINTIYAAYPEAQYNIAGYSLDPSGRICYATDFGIHGDGNKAFQCTEVPMANWDTNIPVSLFECGSLELFDLVDVQRYNPLAETFNALMFDYLPRAGFADTSIPPFIRVQAVKDIRSHTEMERWGFTQFGPTAMVFLPAQRGGDQPATNLELQPTGSEIVHRANSTRKPAEVGWSCEILLGGHFTNFAVLNHPDEDGHPRGYSLGLGESIRLAGKDHPSPAQCVEQLAALNAGRMAQFAQYDVSSPLANRYRKESSAAIEASAQARRQGDYEGARANDLRSWVLESATYRSTLALLMDVVSTTVLYFVLLIPFSFLIERLVFPQRTTLLTVLVSTAVFALFAGVLYMFHPGFKLAHNILVITISFVIVVMSLPALILLLVRGIAMLRAIGSKVVITQRSEAESAGVIMASLSLAVSNMRRRKLRTTLTLATITILVTSLVLLTTSSAFDFRMAEPVGLGQPSFEGVQVYNTQDRRKTLIPEMVRVYEQTIRRESPAGQTPLILRREFVNYGYDHKLEGENACVLMTLGQKRQRVPYFQVMDSDDDQLYYHTPRSYAIWRGAIGKGAVTPEQQKWIRLSDLVDGRFLEEGDVDVCLLPSLIADGLGAKVGDVVQVMGMPLKVVGIWASELKIAQGNETITIPGPWDDLVDLDGLPITALRQSAQRQGQPDSPVHAKSSEIVVVPRAWTRKTGIFPTTIESLIIAPRRTADGPTDTAAVMAQAQKLAREILNVDVFCNLPDPKTGHFQPDCDLTNVSLTDRWKTGQTVSQRLSMRTATQIKGSSMMLVVLAVAVLMILAIMTGTVYERMKEIHVFSSVGLSPQHVAGMFFVEAIVFAGIASVLGYFIGVIALKILLGHLKSTGQAAEFYPNYLGVYVLYSIGVAVVATLLSSLYPIRLAARIVNPSAGKGWKFDEDASGDEVNIKLPFIATTWLEAQGMMVYAYDCLAIHQGERSGRFVCERPPAGTVVGQELRLEMPIWLAPFERNLSQQTTLVAQRRADGAWWELTLDLRRISGQDYLWRRGATVFVNSLCKNLLRYRAVSAQQEAQSAQRADSVFIPRTAEVTA